MFSELSLCKFVRDFSFLEESTREGKMKNSYFVGG